jgi:hypothetical protein
MDVMEIKYEIERHGCRMGATASLDPGEGVVESYERLQRMVEREHARFAPPPSPQAGLFQVRPDDTKPEEIRQAEWVVHQLGNGAYRLGNHLCCKVHGAAAVVRCNGPDGTVMALTELIVQAQALLCDLKKSA